MAKARETTSDNYDTGLREQPSTLAQRDLIATVLDMKVDVRLEMQRMSQRIGRIEELLHDLVNRLVVADSSNQSTPSGEGGTIIPPTITSPTGSTSLTVAGTSTGACSSSSTSNLGPGGNGLGPILLRKRRSKNRKAPAPPKQSPETVRLIDSSEQLPSGSKRDFL